jgi:hypothetical protein
MSRISTNRGYTLLFAALTAAVVLGVAVFILSVSRKQFILSSTARESTYAIYAADSVIECAARVSIASTTQGASFNCNDNAPLTINMNPGSSEPVPNGMIDTHQTSLHVPLSNNSCAKLIFTTGTINGTPYTVIDSRGYNLCTVSGPDTSSPRTVERALRLTRRGVW